MPIFIAGLLIFLGVHSVRMAAPGFRNAQIELNEGRWKGLFSLASLVGFALIIWGWILFRPEAPVVFAPPSWGRHAAMLLVWFAFVANVAAYQPAGRIKVFLKHPFLTGIILWATGHLLANGDLASLLLFGSFLVYALVDRVAVSARPEADPVFVSYRGDVIALVGGTIAYLVFMLLLHGLLFGVSPTG